MGRQGTEGQEHPRARTDDQFVYRGNYVLDVSRGDEFPLLDQRPRAPRHSRPLPFLGLSA